MEETIQRGTSLIALFIKYNYYQDDQMKEDNMGWVCGAHMAYDKFVELCPKKRTLHLRILARGQCIRNIDFGL